MKEGSSESLTIHTYTLENIVFHVKMGMEVRFAQNYGWEMGFTPHPLPLSRTLVIVTLSTLFIIAVVTGASIIATDCCTCEIRKDTCRRLYVN